MTCLVTVLQAGELAPGLTVATGGGMRVEGHSMDIRHWDEKWLMTQQNCEWKGTVSPEKGFPKTGPERWALRGKFHTHAGKIFALEQHLEQQGPETVKYRARMTSADGVPTNTLAVVIDLPQKALAGREIFADGKARKLPGAGELGMVKELILPVPNGKLIIGGPVKAYMQDFEVRLMFSQQNGEVKDSSLEFTLRNAPYTGRALDISGVANMGFRDETPDDRKGGWTDQGENDLRKLAPGPRRFGGLPFEILDPAKHEGKACLVFAGPQRSYFLKQASVPAEGAAFECLYLLHAIAWTPSKAEPVGRVRIEYADGTRGEAEVVFGQDVADWWAPYPLQNGVLAWTAENRLTQVGLYLSKFRAEKKPVTQVVLEGTGKAVWMVAGLVGGEDVPFPAETASTIAVNNNWKPLELKMDVAAGSILDFSFLLDAPAGKHGAVVAKHGRFEFEQRPGKRVRFYGANICHWLNFPATKAVAEQLAEQLARMGYNTIRLHHYDGPLSDPASPGGTGLNPVLLDRMEYFFHCLKQRGIYLSIDLYTLRPIKKGGLPGVDRDLGQDFKDLIAGMDAGFENWKAFSRNLLTHKNPYTGLTWAEDPALFSICVVNEDYIGHAAGGIFRRAYDTWLKEKGVTPGSDAEKRAAAARFTSEVNLARYRKCKEFLRSLGVKALLTDANAGNHVGQAFLRDELDYVDNHEYWDHPKFVDGYGQVQSNTSAIRNGAAVPLHMAPTRIFGKPFMVTEYNFVYPNHFRAESGPLVGAYACLQDWDGLYRFDYSDNAGKTQSAAPTGAFSIAGDPINIFSDRIATLIFQREDFRPAAMAIPFAVTDGVYDTPRAKDWACGPFPLEYAQLGLRLRIGSTVLSANKKPPAGMAAVIAEDTLPEAWTGGLERWKPEGAWRRALEKTAPEAAALYDPSQQRFAAETGELDLDGRAGTFKAVSWRSECLILSEKGTLQGTRLAIENEGGFVVAFVSAMDSKPLAESKRLLVMHLTDTQNSMVKFRNSSHTVMSSGGGLPPLVRRGQAKLRIRLDGEAAPKVFAVDMAGERKSAVAVKWEDGHLSFTAQTVREQGAALAYEIVRE